MAITTKASSSLGFGGLRSGMPTSLESPTMTTADILLIDTTDRVRTITFNRPEARNALSSALRKQFFAALRDFMYWENYDVRGRMDGKIDRVVLDDILKKRK